MTDGEVRGGLYPMAGDGSAPQIRGDPCAAGGPMAIQPHLLAEALRDRYRLVRELGRGGMATVWLAQDLRHDRPVALKLLHQELAASLGPERFLREIHTAGRLQHPHILPVLDSGNAPLPGRPDLLWYTMPYVEGETLRERLRRERQLPVDDALRIGQEIALALDHAHRHGVVHRDVKPENILLADQALLADFGIARALGDEGRITETGMTVGTPAYMSPEQASATRELDGRSDIYSLGCVLYEMLAGEPPHSAATAQAIIGRRLSEPAPPVRRARPAASPEVEQAVATALAPIPADRFRTAGEMAEALDRARRRGGARALGRWGAGARRRALLLMGILAALAVGTFGVRVGVRRWGARVPGEESGRVAGAAPAEDPRPSVAVLPLVNLSPDRENEYFSDGMTEELITALGKVEGLRVAARTSAFAFKGKEADVREIGAKLNVGTVLEGSVRRAGRRLRVTAQLVSTKDGYHLWSEEYDRELADVFAVQDDLARAIVGALRVTLQRPAGGALVKAGTADLQAHDLYLQGRFHWNRRTYESLSEAVRYFERAIGRDSTYAEAFAGLAETYVLYPGYGVSFPAEAYPRARSAALRALALDSTLGNAHATLGVVRAEYEYDWLEAERELRRAIALDSGYATAHQWYAEFLSSMGGRDAEARREAGRAVALDPLSSIVQVDQAVTLARGRHLDEAIDVLRRVLETNPGFLHAHNTLGWVYAGAGRLQEAAAELETAVRASNGRSGYGRLAWVYGRLGRTDSALAITRSLIERFRREQVFPYAVALGYAGVGDRDRALDWLERAADAHDPNIALFLGTDPLLDSLRGEPRFQRLLRRIGLG
jgi:TolB-like protein